MLMTMPMMINYAFWLSNHKPNDEYFWIILTLFELLWAAEADAGEKEDTFASGDENLKLFFVKSTVGTTVAVEMG